MPASNPWNGWLSSAKHCPSPNFNARPCGSVPEMVVVHNISLPEGCFGTGNIEALFCNVLDCAKDPTFEELAELEVSAHFLIDRQGQVTQFVSCLDRAWHAGVSAWAGRLNCNDFSIGIELEGTDTQAYEHVQYQALSQLLGELRDCLRSLASGPIVGHSDIAPGRKTDPGAAFDWSLLRHLLAKHVDSPAITPPN